MNASIALMAFVTLQRLGELVLANRNTQALKAGGAIEYAPAHYPLIVAFHAAWLAGLWWAAPLQPMQPAWLFIFALLQLCRVWVIATLGARWTTRIIVLPGAPLVQKGPFKLIRHPNYAVVAGEIFVLPMVFGLVEYALVFSAIHLLVLAIRIRAENRALAA